ncbi:MAG: right-handed parallel beta-helix repeat-containing protein [Promethearchaeota archaeon]
MSLFNFIAIGKKRRQTRQMVKIIFCLFLTLIFILNFIYLNDFSKQANNNGIDIGNGEITDFDHNHIETSTDISMLQNPYTLNLAKLLQFFDNNYKSSLDYELSPYFRYGDNNGIITDDTIFAEDNLFLYSSLKKSGISDYETFDLYLKLKETPLWYESTDQQTYGFVKSIDNSTGEIKDDNRYLVDNLLPIFLLIENIGDNIDDININNIYPTDSIEEIFDLIDSTEFWDEFNNGFAYSNSSLSKYSISNFYSILANLLIHRTYYQLDLNEIIRDRAYYLANETMASILNFMWDSTDKAFRSNANSAWNPFAVPGGTYYHLDVNALGIITLLEFWVGSGMENDSIYLQRAIELFNSLNDNFWDSVDSTYYNIAQPSWIIVDSSNNLHSNALMMEACLKLFELTANITYYDRAIELFNSFENNFYDVANNAYDFSITDNNKNLLSNLRLSHAYLMASKIYNNTILHNNYSGIRINQCYDNCMYKNMISKNLVGVRVEYSSNNVIMNNNFIKNIYREAYHLGDKFLGNKNNWSGNYWNRPRLLPKPIFGRTGIFLKLIPCINFDWAPAKKPIF